MSGPRNSAARLDEKYFPERPQSAPPAGSDSHGPTMGLVVRLEELNIQLRKLVNEADTAADGLFGPIPTLGKTSDGLDRPQGSVPMIHSQLDDAFTLVGAMESALSRIRYGTY